MKRPPGTGTIETTPDGRHRPRLPRHMGRRYLDVCDTEAEALAALALAMEETPPDAVTLLAWGERWIEHRKAQGYRSTAHELRHWKHYMAGPLGRTPLHRVSRRDVQRWVDRYPGSGKTASNALGLIRGALRWAVREGQIAEDPTIGVMLPPRKRAGWDWLRDDEVARLLANCDGPKQRSILTTAIYTGCRAGELWGLSWDDVDTRQGVIRIRRAVAEDGTLGPPKNGKPREVPLLSPVREALDEWRPLCPDRNRLGLLWPGRYGGAHPRGHRADLRGALKRAGLRVIRFHDLRHTCASHLIQGTWAPTIVHRALRLEEVQAWLGHSSRTMTERYAHLAPDGLRALRVVADGLADDMRELREKRGDPRGIRTTAVGASDADESAISAAVGHAVGQVVQGVRHAMYEGDPVHAWARVLDVLREAEERHPLPSLATREVGR